MRKTKPLDQDVLIGAEAHSHAAKVHNKLDSQGSIMEKLMDFASSVPDFRRQGKGNIRHKLKDVIILTIFARASKCVGRGEIIEFGRRNFNKFRRLGMLKNGVPSEATLCRMDKAWTIRRLPTGCRRSQKHSTESCPGQAKR